MISIIIITFNRCNEVIDVIRNLLNVEIPQGYKMELIIINNNSSESYLLLEMFLEELRKNKNLIVKYVKLKKNCGVAGGRNLGIFYASGELLFFLDDDAIIMDKKILYKIIKIFNDYKNVGICAFKSIDYYSGELILNEFPHHNKSLIKSNILFCSHFIGVANVIKREVFNRVGLYPADFFYGMEEYDLSYRALDAGFKILYSSDLIVYHKKVSSGRGSSKFVLKKLCENKIKVAIRNLPIFYVLTHLILWSGKYLIYSKFHFKELIGMYKTLYHYLKRSSRKPISSSTLKYIKKELNEIIYY